MTGEGAHTHDGGGAVGDQFDHLLAADAWGDLLAAAESATRDAAPNGTDVTASDAAPNAAGAPGDDGTSAAAVDRIVDSLVHDHVDPLPEHDLLALWHAVPAADRTAPVPAPGNPEPVYDPEDELHTGDVDGERPPRPDLLPVRDDVRRTLARIVAQLAAASR